MLNLEERDGNPDAPQNSEFEIEQEMFLIIAALLLLMRENLATLIEGGEVLFVCRLGGGLRGDRRNGNSCGAFTRSGMAHATVIRPLPGHLTGVFRCRTSSLKRAFRGAVHLWEEN
ncbi:hypothetical protein [Ochrobactrum sp. 19YEA23]|uniref:hypothetical protein n=1 Tax=Ochrobactrum sp. 19YEA23 TaxID=3039854 RepID=UPI00247950D3